MEFERVYHDALERAARGQQPLERSEEEGRQLDCLLHPENYPPVLRLKDCNCSPGEEHCAAACLFQAIVRDEQGKLSIDSDRCQGCSACLEACQSGGMCCRFWMPSSTPKGRRLR